MTPKFQAAAITGTAVMAAVLLTGTAWGQSAAEALPQKYRDAGTLNVGMVLDYPPYAWIDPETGETTGLEVDVGLAIGAKLGIEWNIVNAKWEGLITGVGSERFDVGAGGTSDLEERQRIVTFVDYTTSSDAVIVLENNAERFPDVDSICGHSVGALKGTTTATVAENLAEQCAERGLPSLHVNLYTSVPDADLALQSGRDAAQIGSNEQASFIIKMGEQPWKIIHTGTNGTPMGPYVSVSRPDLAEAILVALKELHDEGALFEIASKYGLEGSLIEPGINLATANR